MQCISSIGLHVEVYDWLLVYLSELQQELIEHSC